MTYQKKNIYRVKNDYIQNLYILFTNINKTEYNHPCETNTCITKQEGDFRDVTTKPCWEFYDCPEQTRKYCPVYLNWKKETTFCEGWLYFDIEKGGPAERGPCYDCEWNHKHGYFKENDF